MKVVLTRETFPPRIEWWGRLEELSQDELARLHQDKLLIHRERGEYGDHDPDSFVQASRFLPLHLLRLEEDRSRELCDLVAVLAHHAPRESSLFLGPTMGAEVEILAGPSQKVALSMPYGMTLLRCEERLLEDRVDFESIEYEGSSLLEHELFDTVVISRWPMDTMGMTRLAYNVLGLGGLLLVSSTLPALVDAMHSVDLRRLPSPRASVVAFRKDPDLPERLSVGFERIEGAGS